MEPYNDKEIEEMLTRSGNALTPGRARFQALIKRSVPEQRSQLSPLSVMFFMNTTSKVLVALVAVVALAGGGMYLSGSSRPATVAETNPEPTQQNAQDQGTGTPVQPVVAGTENPDSPTAAASASPALAAIDSISASLQSDLSAQSSEMSALDQSANQNVALIDTANSSKQPYDENSI